MAAPKEPKAGIVLFCKKQNVKYYLLGKESKWVKDDQPEGVWLNTFDHVSDTVVKTEDAAKEYFKDQYKAVQALAPLIPKTNKSTPKQYPVHYAHIQHVDGVYKTKWCYCPEKQKYGFPKGGCKPRETILDCAKREFGEETFKDLQITFRKSISFTEGTQLFKFYVGEIEYDIMDTILADFEQNTKINRGDGSELCELKLYTEAELIENYKKMNFVSKHVIDMLFPQKKTRSRRSRSYKK